MRRTALAGEPNQDPSSVSDVAGSLAPVERRREHTSPRASASSSDFAGPVEDSGPSSAVPRLPPREFARSAFGGLAFGAVCIGLLQIPLGPPTSAESSGYGASASGAAQPQVMAHPAPGAVAARPVLAAEGSPLEHEPRPEQFAENEQPASETEISPNVDTPGPASRERSNAGTGPAQLSKGTAHTGTAGPAAGQPRNESQFRAESVAPNAGLVLRAGKVKRKASADAPTGRFPAMRE